MFLLVEKSIHGLWFPIIIELKNSMSRETQTSTFNDGLNKDLTPMLTPNTVMTDCLNGTIITYNGNEFALQNDLGNYKFNHGHLNQGFVPVGIKEHANILYIISYNPVTDEVEVGSFPSMKTIFSSGINTGKERDFSINLESGFNLFTKLSQDSGLKMISDLNDDFLLNPGDKYMLSKTGQDDKFDDWAHISTYVFTENQKIYNIDKYITYSSSVNTNDSTWNIVNWDVPGYIAVKMLPHVMDEFNCYVTEFNSESANIHVQSIWNGNIYSKYIDSIKDRIGYLYTTNNNLDYSE